MSAKRVVLLSGASIVLAFALYTGLLLLDVYWNLATWRPRWDLLALALVLWIAVALAANGFVARASREGVGAWISAAVALALALVGLYAVSREATSEGLFARLEPSPFWYRVGRAGLMGLPLLFWVWRGLISPCCRGGANYNKAVKHAGKSRQAGLKLIGSSLVIVVSIIAIWSFLLGRFAALPAVALGALWLVFFGFSLNFFRDPEAQVPADTRAVVSPAHGTVDVIEEAVDKQFMGGKCRRISIFLSVFDVHIQNAPVNGRVALLKHCPGRFVNAMRSDCGDYNENVFIGIESSDAPGERVAVKLIAGLLARRIVPWIAEGDLLRKGERTSLIQFGSRVDLYLPMSATIQATLGQKVTGGETVMAVRV